MLNSHCHFGNSESDPYKYFSIFFNPCVTVIKHLILPFYLFSLPALSSVRLAPKGDEDECKEHLAEAEEALVRFDPQLSGLLQELREELLQDGNSGPQLPLLHHSARRASAQGDR